MSRAVANTLLPAARPASTIARPRPRELPVTNHTCAIHPPLSSNPPDILEKLLKLRIGCAMGIRKDLLVTEEIRRIFRPLRSAIVRRSEKNRAHHGFNPGCHLLRGDAIWGLIPAAGGAKNGPGCGRRQQRRIDSGC